MSIWTDESHRLSARFYGFLEITISWQDYCGLLSQKYTKRHQCIAFNLAQMTRLELWGFGDWKKVIRAVSQNQRIALETVDLWELLNQQNMLACPREFSDRFRLRRKPLCGRFDSAVRTRDKTETKPAD